MPDSHSVTLVAALIGDPTRARMLTALMDGRARTATELALEGGVSASTASSHLARLTEAGLLAIERQGRHRFFRIRTPEVGAVMEGLMGLAAPAPRAGRRPGPRDPALRRARVCYDHLAGEVGVRLLDRMRERRLVAGVGEEIDLTGEGEAWCDRLGLDLAALRARRRRLCRECLDWSERRAHLAGALGAALLDRMLVLRLARRAPEGRTVLLSPRGEAFVERLEVV